MTAAVITGAASALPATLDQRAAWDGFFARHYDGVRAAERIFMGAGVQRRHAVANPMDEDLSGWGTGARMARFIEEALPLGKQAVAWALGRRRSVRMVPIRSTAVVFAGYGRKR